VSLIGTLVLHSFPKVSGSPPEIIEELTDFQDRGAWSVGYMPNELVGAEALPLLSQLCEWTGQPSLTAFIFEGDCAFVSALTPDGSFFSSCLARAAAAGLDDLDSAQATERYGSPEQASARAAAWAVAAGLRPDVPHLTAVFSETGEDDSEIWFGYALFNRLLAALGVPASTNRTFYDDE